MSSAAEVPFIDTTVLAAAATAELEDWGLLDEATDAGTPMQVHGLTMWSAAADAGSDDEGGPEAGTWQCTAGPSYWVQAENEFVYILSGSLTVTPDGGKPATFGAGDCAMFPRGWRGTWDLHETVRKVYVVF
jgi:uncharacterized cupin superfamily protein